VAHGRRGRVDVISMGCGRFYLLAFAFFAFSGAEEGYIVLRFQYFNITSRRLLEATSE
jgi:hypothetical protein